MRQNNFKYWHSKENKVDNQGVISSLERNEDIKLPNAYKEMVRFRDGGTLEKIFLRTKCIKILKS